MSDKVKLRGAGDRFLITGCDQECTARARREQFSTVSEGVATRPPFQETMNGRE